MSEPQQENRYSRRACVTQKSSAFDADSWHEDGQECPSCGFALYRWADATPLAVHDSPQPRANHSYVKQEVTDITILHDVGLTFHSQFACRADVFFGLVGFQIGQRVNFAANEATFEVTVNHVRRLRCSGSHWNRPCTYFFLAGREVTLQSPVSYTPYFGWPNHPLSR